MVTEINKAWSWKGFKATEIIRINDFGNIIFKTSNDEFWRICPEELSCEIIAKSRSQFENILKNPNFIESWEMIEVLQTANSKLGTLKSTEKYYLKLPAVIGGDYNIQNIEKISFTELISLSGDLAFQIKDLSNGQKIKLTTQNNSLLMKTNYKKWSFKLLIYLIVINFVVAYLVFNFTIGLHDTNKFQQNINILSLITNLILIAGIILTFLSIKNKEAKNYQFYFSIIGYPIFIILTFLLSFLN